MKTSNETDKAVVTFQKILGQFYKELRTVIPYTMLTKLYNNNFVRSGSLAALRDKEKESAE